jgi:hypothetical protein
VDKSYVRQLVSGILEKEFKSPEKRRIHEYPDRLNYACPVCGDSKDDRKKRGNLYLNRLYHICFNCGSKMTLDRLCRRFEMQVDPEKKLEMIEFLNSQIHVSDYQDEVDEFDLAKLFHIDELTAVLRTGEHGITDFAPVQPGGGVSAYLSDRMINDGLRANIYQAKYWYDDHRFDYILCLLNRKGDRVLSMQIRNLKQGKRRMFKIYNYESLYTWVHGRDASEDLDVNMLVTFNKLSYYFNILNVDFSSEITIFEGYLDSLFFPNSIGVIGVNTSMRFLEQNSGLQIRYFFDNDSAGHAKSEEKLRQGYKVFLWRKLFDHVVAMKRGADPYKLMHRISKVKDLNDLCVLTGGSCAKLGMPEHFSSDLFDLSYLPKRQARRQYGSHGAR